MQCPPLQALGTRRPRACSMPALAPKRAHACLPAGFAYKNVAPHVSGFSEFCIRLLGSDLAALQLHVRSAAGRRQQRLAGVRAGGRERSGAACAAGNERLLPALSRAADAEQLWRCHPAGGIP